MRKAGTIFFLAPQTIQGTIFRNALDLPKFFITCGSEFCIGFFLSCTLFYPYAIHQPAKVNSFALEHAVISAQNKR